MRIKLDLVLQSITIVFLIGLLTLTAYNSYVYGASNDELVITTR
jgi:high-affinity K+ transport system ATPase subunit B